jgi:hypothetical protein
LTSGKAHPALQVWVPDQQPFGAGAPQPFRLIIAGQTGDEAACYATIANNCD